MDGFIDALSPEAEKRITAYNKQVIELIGNIGKASAVTVGGKTPSQTDSAIKDLNAQLLKQDEIIKKLQGDYVKLAETQKKASDLTSEEITGRRILASNANQQAMATIGLAGAYRNLSAQQAIAARKVQDLISSGKKADQTQRQYNQELRKAQREFDELNKRVLKADNAVGKFNRNVGNYPRAAFSFAKDLIGAFGIVAGVGAIAAVTNNIYENIKAQQSLDLALKSVTATSAEYARAQEFINELAQKQGLEINNLQKQYTAFYVAASGKLSDADLEQVFGDIARSGAALGLTNEALERSFNAVNQMLSKGTVASEELRGQLAESLPGAVQAMTRAVQILHPELKNLTEKDLFNLIKEGRILASEVLPETAKQLALLTGAENAQNVDTLTKSVNRLSNEWKNFIRELNDGDGVLAGVISRTTNGMANIVKYFTNAIKSAAELRKEELNSYRTDLYTQELDALQALGKEAKAQASIRKPIIEAQLADENKLVEILNARLKTQEVGGAAYLQTLKELKAANNDAYGSAGQLDAVNKVLKDIGVNTKANTELTEKQKKALEEAAKQAYENRKRELELDLQVIDRTLNDEEVYYNTRLRALELHWKKRQEILVLAYNEELRQAKGNLGKQKEALLKFHSENLKGIEEYNKQREQLESLALNPAGTTEYTKAKELLNKSSEKEIENFEKLIEKGKEHEKGLEDQAKAMEQYAQTFVDSFGFNSGMQTTFDILNGNILGFGADAKVTALAVAESFQEMFNFISQMSQENFDAQKERLIQETEIALAFAGDSQTAQEEIKRQAAEKEREIARRELNAKKSQAKFNVGIDLAQAIMATFARVGFPAGIPLAAIMTAIGLAQIAAINSQQIPEFYKGTENAPQGFAWTQERGQELILDKNNKVKSYGNNKGAQLTKLDAGDKVKTAEETKRILSSSLIFDNQLNNIMANNGISSPIVVQNNLEIKEDLNRLGNNIVSAIQNKTEYTSIIDKNGHRTFVGNAHSRKEILNNHVTFNRG